MPCVFSNKDFQYDKKLRLTNVLTHQSKSFQKNNHTHLQKSSSAGW